MSIIRNSIVNPNIKRLIPRFEIPNTEHRFMDKRNEIPDSPSGWKQKGLSRRAWEQLYKIKDTPPTKISHDLLTKPEEHTGAVILEEKTKAIWRDSCDPNHKIIQQRTLAQKTDVSSEEIAITDALTIIEGEAKYTFAHQKSIIKKDITDKNGQVTKHQTGYQLAKFIDSRSNEKILYEKSGQIIEDPSQAQTNTRYSEAYSSKNTYSYDTYSTFMPEYNGSTPYNYMSQYSEAGISNTSLDANGYSTNFYTTTNDSSPYSFQADTEHFPKGQQKRKAEYSQAEQSAKKLSPDPQSFLSREEKSKEQIPASPEQNLPPEIEEILDKIKLLNSFNLDRVSANMSRSRKKMGSNPETAQQTQALVEHFMKVKRLNSQLNMPNADIKKIYAKNVAKEGIESYSILEENYNHGNLTETIKGYYYQSEFDFARR